MWSLIKFNDEIHLGTVTVGGIVKPGTHFDPGLIADKYWELYQKTRRA